jgi:hypothetical protein
MVKGTQSQGRSFATEQVCPDRWKHAPKCRQVPRADGQWKVPPEEKRGTFSPLFKKLPAWKKVFPQKEHLLGEVRVITLHEAWNKFKPEPVAEVSGIGVGLILAPRLPLFQEVIAEF